MSDHFINKSVNETKQTKQKILHYNPIKNKLHACKHKLRPTGARPNRAHVLVIPASCYSPVYFSDLCDSQVNFHCPDIHSWKKVTSDKRMSCGN